MIVTVVVRLGHNRLYTWKTMSGRLQIHTTGVKGEYTFQGLVTTYWFLQVSHKWEMY